MPRQTKGQTIKAATLNAYADAIDESRGVKGPRINHPGKPTSLPSSTFVVKYVSQTDNYLVCTRVSADGTDGTQIEIAKPFGLQVQTWDGNTLNGIAYAKVTASKRTATSGTDTETQIVIPAYFVGMPYLNAAPVVDENGNPATFVNGSSGSTLEFMQFTAQEWAEEFAE